MGCAMGKEKRRNSLEYMRRNTLVQRPDVSILAGQGIQIKNLEEEGRVIFIFGGPGSGKGVIVNNLIKMFNFRFVCGEDLIIENLTERVLQGGALEPGVTIMGKLVEMVNRDSSWLTLNLAMELIEKEMKKYKGETILVDLVPSVKFLLRIPTFVKECRSEISKFEEKYPVAFAINLSLDQEHLVANINQTHACTKAPGSTTEKEGQKEGQSDEMDMQKATRRFNAYLQSVNEFLKYFDDESRLLTVDTSLGSVDAVWEGVKKYVLESEVAKPARGLQQVILFKTAPTDYNDVDRERYPMMEVSCKQLIADLNNTASAKVMSEIKEHLRKNAVQSQTFVIDVIGTSLLDKATLKQGAMRKLMFLEHTTGQLDFFMHRLKRRTQRRKSFIRKQMQSYKAIVTGDNEALIFPQNAETELCHLIGLTYTSVQ